MKWQEKFVGRDDDLDILRGAWEEAKSGEPRVVALVAESGFGKTRLAQEFFNYLSVAEDNFGSGGYWPDKLLRKEDNLCVNPEPSDCGIESDTMPFLWWGMRISDRGQRNATALRGSLVAGLDILKPHLATYEKAHRETALSQGRLLGSGKAAADLILGVGETAIEVFASFATFGLLGIGKTVVETGIEQRSIANELRELRASDVTPSAVEERSRDKLAETVIADLSRLAKAPPKGMEAIPLVLLIDDAQWLPEDAGMSSFLDLLMKRARDEDWPLLLILTSWRQEWKTSVAAGTMPGKLAIQSGGDVVHELGGVEGLDAVIKLAFPGLPAKQVARLANKAEGAPRLLDEMLVYLDKRKKLFVGRDLNAALTETGIGDVISHDFAEFVAKRLEEAPENVRRALAIASTQGIRFSCRIVRRVAEGLRIADADLGLLEGEDPHSFIVGDRMNDVAEFRLRSYHNAVKNDLGNLLDEVEVDERLLTVLADIAKDPESATDDELALILDFTFREDLDSEFWKSYAIGAAGQMIERAKSVYDIRSAGEIAERTLALFDDDLIVNQWAHLLAVIDAVTEWKGPRKDVYDHMMRLMESVTHSFGGQAHPKALRSVTVLFLYYGQLLHGVEGPAAARPIFEVAVESCRLLAGIQPTPEAQRDLAAALNNFGALVSELDGTALARPYFEEAISIFRTLFKEQPTPNAQYDLSIALSQLGAVMELPIESKIAELMLDEAAEGLRWVVEKQPTPAAQRSLAATLGQSIELARKLGRPAAACALLDELIVIYRFLAKDKSTYFAQYDLASALMTSGTVARQLEGAVISLPFYEEAVGILRNLAEDQPTPHFRRGLANSLQILAALVSDLDGPRAARSFFEESVEVYRILAKQQPTPDVLTGFSIVLQNFGILVTALDGDAAAQPILDELAALKAPFTLVKG